MGLRKTTGVMSTHTKVPMVLRSFTGLKVVEESLEWSKGPELCHGPLASEERADNSSATLLTALNRVYLFKAQGYKRFVLYLSIKLEKGGRSREAEPWQNLAWYIRVSSFAVPALSVRLLTVGHSVSKLKYAKDEDPQGRS